MNTARGKVGFVQSKFFVIHFGALKQSLCENGEKYIPPQVRQAEETVDIQKKEQLERLKKHVKGLINR